MNQHFFGKIRALLLSELTTWQRWLYALFVIYLTFPFLRLMESPQAGLDPSWQIALGWLSGSSLTWGQDIVFTYGPLGKFIYRLPIELAPWELFVYDVFFFGNLLFFHANCFPRQPKFYLLPLFFVFHVFSYEMFGESTTFLWMFIGIYYGFVALHQSTEWKRHLFVWLSFVLLNIIFFTKANFGMIVWLFWSALIILLAIQKKIAWKLAFAYYVIAVGLLVGFASLWHTDVVQYVQSNLHIIKTYNEGMSLFPVGFKKMTLLTYAVFLIIATMSCWSIFKAYRLVGHSNLVLSESFLILVSLGILFILLKYSFLRADGGHYTAFIKLTTYVGILLISFSLNRQLKRFYLLLLPILFLIYSIFYVPGVGYTQLGIWHGIKYRHHILANYLKGLSAPIQSVEVYPHASPLPSTFIQKIGNATVDILPYEISYLYFNRLNYVPRPTLQSYVSADNYLDSLNYAHFNSLKAPNFLIYGLEQSTLKYPWAEDDLTQLSIFQNYQLVDENDSLLLFKRQMKKRNIRFLYAKSRYYSLGEEIHFEKLPANTLRKTQVLTSQSALGKLATWLFQPPQLLTELRGKNQQLKVRMTTNLLEKGFWSNSLCLNLGDARSFFLGNEQTKNELKSMKIVENNYFSGGYLPTFQVVHYYYHYDN